MLWIQKKKKLLISEKKLFCSFRCNCVEPHSPSNDTLKEWRESNISASDIIWGNLSVSVSKTWHNKLYLESFTIRLLLTFLISIATKVRILETQIYTSDSFVLKFLHFSYPSTWGFHSSQKK